MSKEKSVKQEKLKEAAAEESAEDVSPKSKRKKKTGKSQKQLVLVEEKEVEQPLATRGRVKTKVESSLPQAPVSPSVHGLSGPSGRTRSKQQRPEDPVERERRARPRPPFALLSCSFVVSPLLLSSLD